MEFGDRLFWGIMIALAFLTLWLGVLEVYIPLWIGIVLGLVVGFLFVLYGPGARVKKSEAR